MRKTKKKRPVAPTGPRAAWTNEQFLDDCKLKALEYVDAGLWDQAVSAFCSALTKDDKTRPIAPMVVMLKGAANVTDGPSAEDFILGFYS